MPPKKQGTTLFIPKGLLNRLEKVAQKKGYVTWSEYARAKLIEACDRDEEILKG